MIYINRIQYTVDKEIRLTNRNEFQASLKNILIDLQLMRKGSCICICIK